MNTLDTVNDIKKRVKLIPELGEDSTFVEAALAEVITFTQETLDAAKAAHLAKAEAAFAEAAPKG